MALFHSAFGPDTDIDPLVFMEIDERNKERCLKRRRLVRWAKGENLS